MATGAAGIALLLILMEAASAQGGAASESAALRSRFGFDPLKRQPLVLLYRMDLAGNGNSVLELDEIPPGAEHYVTRLAELARFDATGPMPLEDFAVAWQTRAAPNWPPKPARAIVIHRVTPSNTAQTRHNPKQLGKTLLERYDRDRSGALEQAEWQQVGGEWAGRDADHDKRLSVDELAAYFESLQGDDHPTAGNGVELQRGDKTDSPPPGNRESLRDRPPEGSAPRYYRTGAAHERLSSGLPEWFVKKDANRDGQVAMWEFASHWDDTKVADFRQYDLNDDGMITQKEILKKLDDRR